MLIAAENDITAYAGFPAAHWKKIWSANMLERLNREQTPSHVVQVFPTPPP